MEVKISGISPSEYGATLLHRDYASGKITPTLNKSDYRSHFYYVNSRQAVGTLTLQFMVEGETGEATHSNMDKLTQALYGRKEVAIDNYLYWTALTRVKKVERKTDCLLLVTYTLSATKHLPQVIVNGNKVNCLSTVPKTDCVVAVIVGTTGTDYKVGGVVFSRVTKGEAIVIDGYNNKISVNGVAAAERAVFTELITLVPGENTIACNDTVTVIYYPTFI